MCQGPKGESAASGENSVLIWFIVIYENLESLLFFSWSELMLYFVTFSLFEFFHLK